MLHKGLAALFLVGLALVGPVRPEAQPASRRDTTGVESVIRNFRPVYSTSYDISLQRRNWGQTLDFGSKHTGWDFKSNTVVELGEDVFQSTERRSGATSATINGRWIRKLPLTLTLALNRRSQDGFNSTSTNGSTANLRTTYSQRMLGVLHNFNVTGGFVSNSGESQNSGNTARASDRGLSGQLGWRVTWNPLDNAKISSSINVNRENKNSRSEEAADTGPVILELPTTAARNTG